MLVKKWLLPVVRQGFLPLAHIFIVDLVDLTLVHLPVKQGMVHLLVLGQLVPVEQECVALDALGGTAFQHSLQDHLPKFLAFGWLVEDV